MGFRNSLLGGLFFVFTQYDNAASTANCFLQEYLTELLLIMQRRQTITPIFHRAFSCMLYLTLLRWSAQCPQVPPHPLCWVTRFVTWRTLSSGFWEGSPCQSCSLMLYNTPGNSLNMLLIWLPAWKKSFDRCTMPPLLLKHNCCPVHCCSTHWKQSPLS